MRALIGLGAIAILIVGLANVYESTPSERAARQEDDTIPLSELEPKIQAMIDAELVTKLDLPEAQVNGLLWRALSLDEKRTVAQLLAHYAKHRRGAGWCRLVDDRTGKRLAKGSQAYGATIE